MAATKNRSGRLRHACAALGAATLGVLYAAVGGCQWDPPPPFTVVLIPDTQFAAEDLAPFIFQIELRETVFGPDAPHPYSFFDTYKQQMDWIVEHREEDSIEFAIHLGDLTDNNSTSEWRVADRAHKVLDRAGIPYSVLPGNHDHHQLEGDAISRNTSGYNQKFGPHRFNGQGWYGGSMNPAKNDYNVTFFEIGYLQFMVISLGHAPTKDALCWAEEQIRANPHRRVILATHCYLKRGTLFGQWTEFGTEYFDIIDHQKFCAKKYSVVGADGAVVYRELVARHPNIFLVACGHVSGRGLRRRVRDDGSVVHEMLVDYQSEMRFGDKHGNGWMRLLRFDARNSVVEYRPETPLEDVSSFNQTDYYSWNPEWPDHTRSFQYDMDRPLPAERPIPDESGEFNDRTVNSRSSGHQHQPAIAGDGSDLFVVVWTDEADRGVDVWCRGFTRCGCEAFADRRVNAGRAGDQGYADVAMNDTGEFVVVWADRRSGDWDVFVRGFHADGTERFPETRVNAQSSGAQVNPSVDMDSFGNFVVVWQDREPSLLGTLFPQLFADVNIRVAGFDQMGQKTGFSDTRVNQTSFGIHHQPDVAVASSGSFVVAWEDDRHRAFGRSGIMVAGFDNVGIRQFGDDPVNEDQKGEQRCPSVDADEDGNFVVAWEDDSAGPEGTYQIHARRFRSTGSSIGNRITVNDNPAGQRFRPEVATNQIGRAHV